MHCNGIENENRPAAATSDKQARRIVINKQRLGIQLNWHPMNTKYLEVYDYDIDTLDQTSQFRGWP